MRLQAANARFPNSYAAADTGVLDQAPIDLSMTTTQEVAKPLDQVTYEITACNNSVDQATGVKIQMFPPRGTVLISAQNGGVADAAGQITWSPAALNSGACTAVTAVVRVNSAGSYLGDGTVIYNTARVTVDGGDTASAHAALRLCMGDPSTCQIKPPPPCAAPITKACNRTATDALGVLQAAVGLRVCPLCECDVDGSTAITASDALATLRFSVGQVINLRCPPCF
jgi:uncharacterized repeat protein (TIGR01451 family)